MRVIYALRRKLQTHSQIAHRCCRGRGIPRGCCISPAPCCTLLLYLARNSCGTHVHFVVIVFGAGFSKTSHRDQRQRALSFAHYLSSALADPRFVGVHWFQWIDQSAAGRQDRENHQCGFIDVAGRSYPEFTEVVTQSTSRMYAARKKPRPSTEGILADLLGK